MILNLSKNYLDELKTVLKRVQDYYFHDSWLFSKHPQFQIPNLEADGSSFQVKCKVIDLSSAQIPRNSSQSRYHTDDRFQQELLLESVPYF